ncbi:hypothetical protein O6R08_02665 [Cutibacterium equinum]|uniref:Uncharacterized protein n=1 Tax=Cutibacterium equinum TaxID=3016342 RepID=A0ABY7R0Z8_9ACTN|nr:hypothetical protein [Cutibacterium equinum]WCC80444.1 hypothetical protein O6R08_02665 [Cutibacterium equinum]
MTLPTIIWRALIGMGFTLGTPAAWRAAEQIPGPGVQCVLRLSAAESLAAITAPFLLTKLVSKLPRALPRILAWVGVIALVVAVVMSIVNWSDVDPFHGQSMTGWRVLCGGCYLMAALWAIALSITLVGYLLHHPSSGRSLCS